MQPLCWFFRLQPVKKMPLSLPDSRSVQTTKSLLKHLIRHLLKPLLLIPAIISDHQIVAKNITWIFPWYSSLEVKNIHSYFPEGTPIRVFVQRDNSDIWKEATDAFIDGSLSEYDYFIEKRPDGAGMYNYGSLYVSYYGMDTSDTPDVKVQF